MKSDTTFSLQVPVAVFGCVPSGESVTVNIHSHTEMTADEHDLVIDRVMLFVRELSELLAGPGTVKAPGAPKVEPAAGTEHWIGLECAMDDGLVTMVLIGGPAHMAGIFAGDQIVAVNGVPFGPDAVGPYGRWSADIARTKPGDTVFIDVLRADDPADPVRKTVTRPGPGPGVVL